MSKALLIFTIALISLLNAHLSLQTGIHSRDNDCGFNYSPCNPTGAKSSSTPPIGAGLSTLYLNILRSIPVAGSKRGIIEPSLSSLKSRDLNPICCAVTTQCLLLHDFGIPFCYDPFTTNFYLPDNSYGTVINGSYHAADGSDADLLTGAYTLSNGVKGNLYNGNQLLKPNTASLTLPTPFTSKGVGSAIPASALGGGATYTTTITTTSVSATTVPATVISGSTIPATTIQSSIIATKVVTTTSPAASTPSTGSSIGGYNIKYSNLLVLIFLSLLGFLI
ncbi:MAG: hypothetical protein M1829_004425 [Trizodia sp. TS-e1964]|nr:MAG: hypothetical protein M1829_004425 [Trizodia sp. TS-e1964]